MLAPKGSVRAGPRRVAMPRLPYFALRALRAAGAVPALPLLLCAGPTGGGALGAPPGRYREAVGRCLDNLLERGTDRYGPVRSAMLMSIVDARTGEAPAEPLLLDGMVRGEERPGRRNPGGCDLWDDQPLLRALYRYGALTSRPRYGAAADAYVRAFLARARKPNGMLAWGSHLFYNAFTDRVDDDAHGDPHEVLVHLADWEDLWRVDPAAVTREIQGIWRWHIVDKGTGQHNRHDDATPGCDFAFSGGSFVHAFAFLHAATRQPVWLERARLVAGWHWRHRDPRTGLAPDAPSTGERYDAHHCFTTVTGPHAAALLRGYALTRDAFLRDAALTYLRAYDRYGWDAPAGRYHAALRLDGTPVPEAAKGAGYDRWMPTGHADTWPTTMFSYEFPLAAAQTTLYAYELTREPDMLVSARRWARHIRGSMPPAIGRRWRKEAFAAMPDAARLGGAYAEGYGRSISFFVHLYRATSDAVDLRMARMLADEALGRLQENGWLKGHAAKPYYETTDGVGVLLEALLELDSPPRGPSIVM